MVNLVVVGSTGLDDVETPLGKVDSVLGGSAIYASTAASYFAKPGIVSVIGKDMPQPYMKFIEQFDCTGITTKEKTFRWFGFYEKEMNEAKTVFTQLNALTDYEPIVPVDYQNAKYLLLGNIDPDLQIKALDQMKSNPFIVLDTMNFWITSKFDQLKKAISRSQFMVLNDGEAKQLCNTPNIIKAGKMILAMGPEYVCIKKGEHGALLFSAHNYFSAAGYPLEGIKDPTGAGDSFAGAMIGYLAKTQDHSEPNIRKAVIYGSAVASFCAEHFSLDYTKTTELKNINDRYETLGMIRSF